MRRAAAVSLALAVFISGGCVLNQKPKVAAVPPPPVPPPSPPAPLVFPQNVAKAPPSQPVPPDAIPPSPPGGLAMASAPEQDVPATRSPASRPAPPLAAAPRIETPALPPAEVPAAQLPRQPSTLVSRTDRTRNRAAIEQRIREVTGVLAQLQRQNLTGPAKDDMDRTASMMDLARQALKRGDLRQADDLSSRAAILANALVNAR